MLSQTPDLGTCWSVFAYGSLAIALIRFDLYKQSRYYLFSDVSIISAKVVRSLFHFYLLRIYEWSLSDVFIHLYFSELTNFIWKSDFFYARFLPCNIHIISRSVHLWKKRFRKPIRGSGAYIHWYNKPDSTINTIRVNDNVLISLQTTILPHNIYVISCGNYCWITWQTSKSTSS